MCTSMRFFCRWTPKQFLKAEHAKFVCRACIKINMELFKLGYRTELQIPDGWLEVANSLE